TEYSTQTSILSDAVESNVVNQATIKTTPKVDVTNTNLNSENGKILPESNSRSELELSLNIAKTQNNNSQAGSPLSILSNDNSALASMSTTASAELKTDLELPQQSLKTEAAQIINKLDLSTPNKAGNVTSQPAVSLNNIILEQDGDKLKTVDNNISDNTSNKTEQTQTVSITKSDVTSVNLQTELTNTINQENTASATKVDSISDKIQQPIQTTQDTAIKGSSKTTDASAVLLKEAVEAVPLKKDGKDVAQAASQTSTQSPSQPQTLPQLNQAPRVEIPAVITKPVTDSDAKVSKKEINLDTKVSLKAAVEISPENKLINSDKASRAPIARLLGMGAVSPLANAEALASSLQTTATQTTGTETYSTTRLDGTTNQTTGLVSTREMPLPVHVPRNIWNQRFAEHISMLTLKGASQARIKLDPPELGPMMVRVIHGAETQIQFTVNNPIARDLVDSGMQRLRELLEQQGFDQVDVDVREFKHESHAEGRAADDFDETEIAHLSGQANDLPSDAKPIESYRESIGIIDIFA
ncbi:MAG: flagellar hook-length control protein FliK, partial [Gammaproteobacteria bacterium]|nr:flagellar hook-length control protein FliK [Gammaproteobacteria bacterium]